jgi:hypothetical protein
VLLPLVVLPPIETVSTIEMHFNLPSELVVHTEYPLPAPAKLSTDSSTKASTEQDLKLGLPLEHLDSSLLKLDSHLGQLHRMLLLVAEDCPTNPTCRSRRVRRCLYRVFAVTIRGKMRVAWTRNACIWCLVLAMWLLESGSSLSII